MKKQSGGGVAAGMLLIILVMGAAGEVRPKVEYRQPGSEGKAKLAVHKATQEAERAAECAALKAEAERLKLDGTGICAEVDPAPQLSKRRVSGGWVVTEGPHKGQFIRGGGKYTETSLRRKWYLVKEDTALALLRARIEWENFVALRVRPVVRDWTSDDSQRDRERAARSEADRSREWHEKRSEEWRRATKEGRRPADWAFLDAPPE